MTIGSHPDRLELGFYRDEASLTHDVVSWVTVEMPHSCVESVCEALRQACRRPPPATTCPR